ncbi:MAG TPA: glycerol-3-phosphate dehydrogenase, partial [Pseudomonadales bacterium]|nr:glycerol-3-phosphate dehydrogenase [Pseudomonadales bacterium]
QLNKLAGSKTVHYAADDPGNPIKASIKKAYEYSDCWVDDARLVIANAIGARERGAEILTRTRCVSAKRENDAWKITLQCQQSGATREIAAKALVNAAGPWSQHFIEKHMKAQSPRKLRQIKGSHIIVPRLYAGDHAYILQCEDQRIVFVIPFFENYSVIGTTDCEYKGDLNKVSIDENEINYLLKVVNDHFKVEVNRSHIISTYSGVRPLCDDESTSPSAITRDYTLDIADQDGVAPILNIFGGKLTTYRRLAESALVKLAPYFPAMTAAWTANACLPGGDIPNEDFPAFQREMQLHYPWVPVAMINRLCRQYGTRMHKLLDGALALTDLGICFGQDLYEKEVNYLCEHEWARTVEDIIWRRTKLKLALNANEIEALANYLNPAPKAFSPAA